MLTVPSLSEFTYATPDSSHARTSLFLLPCPSSLVVFSEALKAYVCELRRSRLPLSPASCTLNRARDRRSDDQQGAELPMHLRLAALAPSQPFSLSTSSGALFTSAEEGKMAWPFPGSLVFFLTGLPV